MRRFFIHAGTHKTGTTLIQTVLRAHGNHLADHGFVYPQAGIIPEHNGHHNIAWEVSSDPRYRQGFGTIDQLLHEIGSTDRDVIISSEDFSSALAKPSTLDSFFTRLEQNGFEVFIVLYLRNQVDYIRSIYLELIKHGYGTAFEPFLDLLLERDMIQSDGNEQIWNLQYPSWLHNIPKDDHRKIIVRSYDDARARSLILDFLSVLGLPRGDIAVNEELRINEIWPLGAILIKFYRNNLNRELALEEVELSNWLEHLLSANSLYLRAETIRRIQAKYQSSNNELARQYGVRFFQEWPQVEAGQPKLSSLTHVCEQFPTSSNTSLGEHAMPIEYVFSASMAKILEMVIGYFMHRIAGSVELPQRHARALSEQARRYEQTLSEQQQKHEQALRQQAQSHERALNEQKLQTQQLLQSTSWCLTSPFRKGTALARRFAFGHLPDLAIDADQGVGSPMIRSDD